MPPTRSPPRRRPSPRRSRGRSTASRPASTKPSPLASTEAVLTPTGRSFAWKHEVANALSILPLPVYACACAPAALRSWPALLFTAVVVVHALPSFSFHAALVASQLCPRRFPRLTSPHAVRSLMDVDMSIIHVSGALATTLHANSALAGAAALALLAFALHVIWSSRASARALELELITRRYPCIAAALYHEALLVWLNGDTRNALGMSVVFAVMAALALLDAGPLRGWGHPLSHCALLPGLYFRTEALSVRWG